MIWRWIVWALGGAVVLRLAWHLPLPPRELSWESRESYDQGKLPGYPFLTVDHASPSTNGLLIGPYQPGFVEWHFRRPGPFPSTLQPYWDPKPDGRIVGTCEDPPSAAHVLSPAGIPNHFKAIDLSRPFQNCRDLTIRFEGRMALLESLRWYQGQDSRLPLAPLIAVIIVSILCLPRRKESLGLVGLFLLAIVLRWFSLIDYFWTPLEGDATGYWGLAHSWNLWHPFTTGPREPFFIAVLATGKFLLGDSERSARLVDLLLSSLVPIVTVLAAWSTSWPRRVGWIAGLLVACNPFGIFMSVQAYQLNLYMDLLLLFTMAGFKRRWVWTGILGGLLCVTRVQSVPAVILLLAFWIFRLPRRERMGAGWAILAWLCLIVPYLAAVKAFSGSYLGHLNEHAGYYQAAEQIGDPTKARELPRVGAMDFLFREHSMGQLLRRTAAGYGNMFFNPSNGYNRILLNSHYALAWNWLWLPFFWVGLIVCFVTAAGRPFLLVPVLFLNILPFLFDLYREPRLLFYIQPFVAIIVAVGLRYVSKSVYEARIFFHAR